MFARNKFLFSVIGTLLCLLIARCGSVDGRPTSGTEGIPGYIAKPNSISVAVTTIRSVGALDQPNEGGDRRDGQRSIVVSGPSGTIQTFGDLAVTSVTVTILQAAQGDIDQAQDARDGDSNLAGSCRVEVNPSPDGSFTASFPVLGDLPNGTDPVVVSLRVTDAAAECAFDTQEPVNGFITWVARALGLN